MSIITFAKSSFYLILNDPVDMKHQVQKSGVFDDFPAKTWASHVSSLCCVNEEVPRAVCRAITRDYRLGTSSKELK